MTAEPLRFETTVDEAGQRLDAFLAGQISEASRVRIRRGIDNATAKVDGKVCKASYRLREGQSIEFILPPPPATGPEPEPIPLSILYEDDALAVIDKPPGMVVHPAKGHWSGTLASALVHHFDRLSEHGGASRPGIVHRLDRDTSGAIVIAKTDLAHQRLADQFKARTVRKEYLAIVSGRPELDRDLIDHPIGDHPTHREKKALRTDHSSSREAQTFYEVEERFPGYALIKAMPKTGRTHQIRLHLASIRCPVLCDKLYGGQSRLTVADCRTRCRCPQLAKDCEADEMLLQRQALHAHRVSFAHPFSGEPMEINAPIPDDIRKLLLILRQTTPQR